MDMKTVLRGMELFRDVEEPVLDALARAAALRSYERGEVIFHKEDAKVRFHALLEGRVKIFRGTAGGKEQTLYLVEPGDPFCLCALLGGTGQPVSASAMVPSRVVVIAGAELLDAGQGSLRLLRNIIAMLNRRLMTSMQMVEDLALRDIPQRLASLLLHAMNLLDRPQEEIRLTVPKHEVANILGTTPESVSRILTKFSAQGLVEVQGRVIRILDREALARLAESD